MKNIIKMTIGSLVLLTSLNADRIATEKGNKVICSILSTQDVYEKCLPSAIKSNEMDYRLTTDETKIILNNDINNDYEIVNDVQILQRTNRSDNMHIKSNHKVFLQDGMFLTDTVTNEKYFFRILIKEVK